MEQAGQHSWACSMNFSGCQGQSSVGIGAAGSTGVLAPCALGRGDVRRAVSGYDKCGSTTQRAREQCVAEHHLWPRHRGSSCARQAVTCHIVKLTSLLACLPVCPPADQAVHPVPSGGEQLQQPHHNGCGGFVLQAVDTMRVSRRDSRRCRGWCSSTSSSSKPGGAISNGA